jgi:hypothetical protein
VSFFVGRATGGAALLRSTATAVLATLAITKPIESATAVDVFVMMIPPTSTQLRGRGLTLSDANGVRLPVLILCLAEFSAIADSVSVCPNFAAELCALGLAQFRRPNLGLSCYGCGGIRFVEREGSRRYRQPGQQHCDCEDQQAVHKSGTLYSRDFPASMHRTSIVHY